MSRNLIFCADGTWNKPGEKVEGVVAPTNVRKLYDRLIQNVDNQVAGYDDGVGADGIDAVKWFEGATGAGLDEKIMDGYQFVMNHTQEGDRLFLLGFSRGAYTVRALAQMLAQCGLLPRLAGESSASQRLRVEQAYLTYRENNPAACKAFQSQMQCLTPEIELAGVWDTVGELGIPLSLFTGLNQALFNFHDNSLGPAIAFGYQALAIDEERQSFMPCLWTPRTGIEQLWFAGVHSDVGGGYPEHGLSDITLSWMMQKALSHGVLYKPETINNDVPPDTGDPLGMIHTPWNSPPFNLLPKALRVIPENSLLANSVKVRLNTPQANYHPGNLPKNFQFIY